MEKGKVAGVTPDDGAQVLLTTAMSCLGSIALLFLYTPALWAYEAAIEVKLWAWYLVPFGIPPATWVQCFGINLLLGVFLWSPRKNEMKIWEIMLAQTAAPLMAFGWGWAVHHFLMR